MVTVYVWRIGTCSVARRRAVASYGGILAGTEPGSLRCPFSKCHCQMQVTRDATRAGHTHTRRHLTTDHIGNLLRHRIKSCSILERMFDAIRSLMQDLTNSERCAASLNDKILTSCEDLNIEVVMITALDLFSEKIRISVLLTLHAYNMSELSFIHIRLWFSGLQGSHLAR